MVVLVFVWENSVDEELFLERLKETFPMKVAEYPELKRHVYCRRNFEEYKEYAKIIKPLVCDTVCY